jgi:PEGA domain
MRSMQKSLQCLLLLLVLVAAHQVAQAGTVSVVTGGDPALKDSVTKSAQDALTASGFDAVSGVADVSIAGRFTDCYLASDIPCGQAVFAKYGRTDAMLFVMVEVKPNPSDNTRDISLDGWFFEKGKEAKSVRRFCQRCRTQTMAAATSDLVNAIGATSAADSGRLRISSEPDGARIMVDGQPVGVTPMEYQVPSGNHQVTVDKAGFVTQSETVEVKRSDLASVRIVLVADGTATIGNRVKPDGAVPGGKKSNVVAYSLLIGGGVAIVAGVSMLLLDQSPTGPDGKQRETYFEGTLPGSLLIGAGAVSAGIGTYLWLRSGRSANAKPTVSLAPGSALVNWQSSF